MKLCKLVLLLFLIPLRHTLTPTPCFLHQAYAKSAGSVCDGIVLVAPCGVEEHDVRRLMELFYPHFREGFLASVIDLVLRCFIRSLWLKERIFPLLFNGSQGSIPPTSKTSLASVDGEPASLLDFAWAVDCMSNHEEEFWIVKEGLKHAAPELKSSKRVPALVLVPENDCLIPKESSFRTAKMWGVDGVVLAGQAHNVGDDGWEEASMQPLLSFLRETDFSAEREDRRGGDGDSAGSSESFVDVSGDGDSEGPNVRDEGSQEVRRSRNDDDDDDDDDDNDINIDFGDLAAETEVTEEEAATWASTFGFGGGGDGKGKRWFF